MKERYQRILMAFALSVFVTSGAAFAQSNLVVEWLDPETGDAKDNALRDAILEDTDRPADRVYVLRRGGLYYNVDTIESVGFHLRIVGEEAPPEGEPDFGPPVIQMLEEDGETARMFEIGGPFTLKNVWITGQSDGGATTSYQPIQVNAGNVDIVIDNSIFERSNFHIIGVTGANNRVTITNSVFRNFINTTQQWEGRGIAFTAGAESVILENNTFLNIGHTVLQSEARPINYVRFVHNTMINVGRTINSGGIWKEAYFANNIGINVGWHGEDEDDFTASRQETHTGIFTVAELPPQFGVELERKVVFVNNAFWRDPAFEAWYDENGYFSQPLFNEGLRDNATPDATTTRYFFDEYDNMLEENNRWQVDPGMVSYRQAPSVDDFPETSIALEDLVPSMIQTMETLRADGTTPNWNDAWLWDPGRDPTNFQAEGFVYPLPEDISYTNSELLSAGTNGLPLGNLNWNADAKADWEANHDAYVEHLHGLVEAPEIDIVASFQAETAVLEGDAEVASVEGDTWYTFSGGSAVEWTFDIETEGLYGLRFHVNLSGEGATRGVNMTLNGNGIYDARGWGEFVFPPESFGGPWEEFIELDYFDTDLADRGDGFVPPAEALTLPAGENTLRIAHSWADNLQVLGVDILDAGSGDVVVELRAPEAVAEGATPSCGEGVDFCSQGFQHVAMGPGGSLSMNVDLPGDGTYLVRLFTNRTGSADILVDGETVVSGATIDESGQLLSSNFSAQQGTRNITIANVSGEFDVDWVQVLSIIATSTDRHMLPEGYALKQNYPNPFSRRTIIEYEMGQTGHALVQVFDLLGRRVATLVNADMPSGVHQIEWDGRTDNGAVAASGVYFYRMQVAGAQKTRSMVVVR